VLPSERHWPCSATEGGIPSLRPFAGNFSTGVSPMTFARTRVTSAPTVSCDNNADLISRWSRLGSSPGNAVRPEGLASAIDDAFPGAKLHAGDEGGSCRLCLKFPDMPRAFGAHELSDGTLKYLCLLGALMVYRLPSLIALNEPEASLHPSLLPPLARLIGSSARSTRIWIVTHSDALAEAQRKRDRDTRPAGDQVGQCDLH
jgi:predicted ATPase